MSKNGKEKKVPEMAAIQEEIRDCAEEIFKNRKENNIEGDSLSDWLEAEKVIKNKYGI